MCLIRTEHICKFQNHIYLSGICQKPCIYTIRFKTHFLPFVHDQLHPVCIIIPEIRTVSGLVAQHCCRQWTGLHSHSRNHRYCRCQGTFSHSGQIMNDCNLLQFISTSCFLNKSVISLKHLNSYSSRCDFHSDLINIALDSVSGYIQFCIFFRGQFYVRYNIK